VNVVGSARSAWSLTATRQRGLFQPNTGQLAWCLDSRGLLSQMSSLSGRRLEWLQSLRR
jgi:hypothetical protein